MKRNSLAKVIFIFLRLKLMGMSTVFFCNNYWQIFVIPLYLSARSLVISDTDLER